MSGLTVINVKLMRTYQIIVFASRGAADNNKKLFERLVTVPASCGFDYECVVKALRILYGTKAVISINIYE